MPGMRQSMNTMSYGTVASFCWTVAMASLPVATVSTRAVSVLNGSCRISRATGLSSTTSTRSCASLSGTTLPVPVAEPTSSQTVKLNVLPLPGSLSSQTRPPINSASLREIESPRPVPPCLRVVDMSAWEKGWNSFAACSRVMPMPVSRTENLS